MLCCPAFPQLNAWARAGRPRAQAVAQNKAKQNEPSWQNEPSRQLAERTQSAERTQLAEQSQAEWKPMRGARAKRTQVEKFHDFKGHQQADSSAAGSGV